MQKLVVVNQSDLTNPTREAENRRKARSQPNEKHPKVNRSWLRANRAGASSGTGLMSNADSLVLIDVQPVAALAQGEFEPVTELTALLQPWQRHSPLDPIKLETTGVTSQAVQLELLSKAVVHKDSIVSKLLSIRALDLASPLDKCHTEESFAQCQGCKRVRHFWNRCENFYCPVCQPALAHERAESLEWWAKLISQPKHLVLTVRNSATITWTYVKWFKLCLSKLRRRRFARNWRGGLWSLEVTNEGQGWHLHAHLLVDVNWVDPRILAETWAEIVGQEFAIVKVKDARGDSYLKEVTKYAVKGSQLSSWAPAEIAAFIYAFSGQRTFGVFGTLYGQRSKWAEQLKAIAADRRRCECGCNQWKVYDEAAWQFHQEQFGQPSVASIPPPNKLHTLQPVFWSEFIQPK